MIMTRRNFFRHGSGLLVVLAFVAAACAAPPPQGAPQDQSTPEPPAPASPATQSTASIPPAAAEHMLPSVEIIDLATDARVDIATLTPAATPVLLWFWAPH